MGIHDTDPDIATEREAEMGLALTAFRSIRHPVAYVSMPITSGLRYYNVLERHGVTNTEELEATRPGTLLNDIIIPNIQDGIRAAEQVRAHTTLPPLAPAVFEATKQRWTQTDYMHLWFRVIEERAGELHMTPGWEQSNGATQEFARAMEMQYGFINPWNGMEHFPKECDLDEELRRVRNVRVYDHNGKKIGLDIGIEAITTAYHHLRNRGFNPEGLKRNAHKLMSIAGFFQDPFTTKEEYQWHMRDRFSWTRMKDAWERIQA